MWAYAYRWIWNINVMRDQHLTLMSALLLILTSAPLFSSSTTRLPFHLWRWRQDSSPTLATNDELNAWLVTQQNAVRYVSSYNSAGWGVFVGFRCAAHWKIPLKHKRHHHADINTSNTAYIFAMKNLFQEHRLGGTWWLTVRISLVWHYRQRNYYNNRPRKCYSMWYIHHQEN